MRQIKKNLLLSIILGLISFSDAEVTKIDREHEYIVTGTISAREVDKKYDEFLEQNHLSKENHEAVYQVPDYIQFMKIEKNPNWVQSPNKEDDISSQRIELPPSRILPTSPFPLDQGKFGTCVTFSVLGAIMNSRQVTDPNNAPSPSCMLQMLKYWMVDAWDGFWLNRYPTYLEANQGGYGYVTENFGQQGRCNNYYKTYQPQGSDEQKSMRLISLSDYTNNSIRYTNGSNEYNRFAVSSGSDALYQIKLGINNAAVGDVQIPGRYSAFAFFYNYAPNAWYGSYPVWADDGNPPVRNAGHALFAYGYDDNITVNGQQGVLYLRNSWGKWGNETGSVLMTYAFFIKNYRTDDLIMQFANVGGG
ncbi:MAG: Cysteine protease, papain family [Burkholderiales bacterium]|jgi:hypothetical protein|nr:Cysteine protease, papain family [Burkholderiales bacterium]